MNPRCRFCKQPILNNRGTFWVQGIGGLFPTAVYPNNIVYAHWGQCTNEIGKEFDQCPPTREGYLYFWGNLPFYEVNSTSNSNRFIYIFKSENYYKIGITKDVAKRIRELQTGNPIELALVKASFFENAPEFEKKLHKAFAPYHRLGEWFELSPEKLEELLAILENKDFIEQVPPFENIVYYPPGTRVYWRSQAGTIHSLEVKPYRYEIGYNVILDSQDNKDIPEVINSSYNELILESTKTPSLEGYEVAPMKPNFSPNDPVNFAEWLELQESQKYEDVEHLESSNDFL